MSKTKRLLALFMALCMVAGLVTFIPVTSAKAAGETTVQKAEIISENQVRITFSAPVHLNTDAGVSYYSDLRIIDNFTNQDLQYIGETPLQLGMVYGTYSLSEDNGTIIFTRDGVRDFYRAFTSDSAYANCVLTWCIEDSTGTKNNGLCEAILDASNNPVSATMPREWADQCYVEVKDTGAVHLTDAIQLNETQVAMKFDCGGVWNNGTIGYMAIRLIDGMPTVKGFFEGKFADVYGVTDSDNQHLMYKDGAPLQWHVYPDYLPAGSPGQMVVNLDENAFGINTISGILEYAKQNGYIAALCLEENSLGARGLIDSYGEQAASDWACSGRYLMATNPQSDGCHWDQTYVPITSAENGYLQVTDVKVLGERGIVAQFSEPVKFNGNYDFIIRLVDDNNNLQMGEAGGSLRPNDYLQFGPYYGTGSITNYKNQTNTILGTIDTDYSVIKAYADSHNLHIALNIGDNSSGVGINGNYVVDGIEGSQSGKKLATVGTAFGEGLYYTKAFTKVSPITITKAEIIQDNTANVTFSEAVDFTAHGNGCDVGVAIVDADNNLVWDNSGSLNITGAGNPLFAGLASGDDWQIIGGDSSKWSFTMNNTSVFGTSNLNDIIKETEEGGKYAGYKLAFCIQNYNSTPDLWGAFYSCTAAEGINALGGNSPDPHRCFKTLSSADGITLEKATMIDERNIALQFDCDNVWNNGGVYAAVRLVDNMTSQNLQWEGDTPLQWGCAMDYMSGSSLGQMKAYVADTALGMNTLSQIKAYAAEKGYAVTFCFEEKGDVIGNNGYIDSYGEQAVPDWACNGKYLKATKRGGVDGVYVPITDDENEYLEIKDVYVLGESGIAVEFDEPIKLNGNYDMILRLVDDNNNLQTAADETFAGVGIGSGGYLQFGPYYGASTVTNYGGRANTIVGSFGSDYNTIKNYAEAHGLHIALNIGDNGSGIGGNFIVENIVGTESGNMLKAVQTNFGEGVYYTDAFVEDTVAVESIEVENSGTLKVTFAEEIDYPAAPAVEAWLRLADDNNDIICANGDGTFSTERAINTGHMQWGGVLAPTSDKKVFTWSSGNLVAAEDFYEANKEELDKVGARFTLCFEQYPAGYSGVIPDFTAVNSLKALLSNGVIGNRSFHPITGMENVGVIAVDSIEVTSPSTLEVTFSEEINYPAAPGAEAWLRLADANNDIICNDNGSFYAESSSDAPSGHMQWGGTLSPTADKKVFIWNSTNLLDAKAVYEANKTALDDLGAKFTLCFEQYAAEGIISDFVSLSGTKSLPTNGVIGNRSFHPVTGMDELGAISVESVVPVSDHELEITFSDEVEFGKFTDGREPEFWLRLMADDISIAIKKADGSFTVESGFAGGDDNYCQWSGVISPTADKKVYVWTMNSGNTLGCSNLVNVKSFMDKYADELSALGAKLTLCCEQSIPSGVPDIIGYIDNVTSPDGKMMLAGNNLYGYRHFAEVTGLESVRGIKVVSAVATDNRTVKVTFSEPVVNNVYDSRGGFIAIRLVDENDNLMFRDNKNGSLSVMEDPTCNQPVQFSGQIKSTGDGTVWEFTTDSANISYLMNSIKPGGIWEGYKFKFCIEQQLNDAGVNEIGFVDNFTSPDGKYKLEGVDYLWDRCYVPLSIAYSDPYFDVIHMESAKAINDSMALVQFSEPIEIVGGPFCAIRLVEEGSNYLGWTGEEATSTPLQFPGYFDYADPNDHSKLYFIMNGGQLFGVKTIQDVIEMNGELEVYRDKYVPKLCIEKVGYPVSSGVVENVIGEGNPNKVLEASDTFYRLGYLDGAYCDITSEITPKELNVESVTAINDLQLVVKFDNAIDLSKDNAPFMAVRLVDDDNNLLWDGEVGNSVPLQFTGDWDWYDEAHTSIIWTMHGGNTYGAGNVRELLNFEGDLEAFKDSNIAFCIEELPPNIYGNSGHIENIAIKGDSISHLLGNKAGGYDGCYAPITVDFDLDPLTYTVTAINDIQLYIQFNDSVSIINNPWMSIRFVDGANQLIWSDEVGKSTPMQFPGTWEWANDYHTAIIWTMNGANTCLANTITDVFDYVNGLVAYKGCDIKMCIEELATPDFAVHSFDDLISNIVSTDGQRHLSANKRDGYDGSYKYISVDYDMSSRLEVVEIISNDEKTVDITFNKPAEFDENASLGLCYVDPDGKIGVGIDARDLKFKGTWEYTNDDHTAIKWTIKDSYGVTVKDLLGFMGNYRYYINDGYELKFYIEEGDGCHGWNCLVESVTTDEGKVHLLGTLYGDKDMYIVNLEAAYDYPVYQPEEDTEATGGEPEKEVKYETDYVPFWIGGGAAAAAGAAVGGILLGAGKKKKSIH